MIKFMDNTSGFMAYSATYLVLHKDWIVTAEGPKAKNYISIPSEVKASEVIRYLNKEGYLIK
jgi:hypothetical protein